MNFCIICREEFTDKNPATKEHIIPYAIGGNYTINNVCKCCNSKMGTKIDAPFVRNIISRIHIEDNNILGRSGKVEFPLKGDYEDETGKKFRVISPNSEPILLDDRPDVNIQELEGGKFSVSVSFEKYGEFTDRERESLLNKHKKYLVEKYREFGLEFDLNLLINSKFNKETKKPNLLKRKEVFDFNPFFLESLKIAYEFFVTDYPEYIEHKDVKDIARILTCGDEKRAKEKVTLSIVDENMKYTNLTRCLRNRFGTVFIIIPINKPSGGGGYFISLYEEFISLVTISNDASIDINIYNQHIYSLEKKKELQNLFPYSDDWIKFKGCLNLCKT